MAPAEPLVSYVLVNWNTEGLLPRALSSIAEQDFGKAEVFLVDNGSPGFHEESYAHFDNLTIIHNRRNRGFAAANNQALAQARGAMVVLLNCDAFLVAGFARHAWDALQRDTQVGTVVAKILRDDGSGRIDSAGHIMHEDRTAAHIGKDERDCGQFDHAAYVFGGTAAAIAYRRMMLEDAAIGGRVFDEAFFAYYEDVDLDWRAQLLGWRAYYEPRCVAYHRGHGSGGRARRLIQLIAEKNRYLMLVKNDSLAAQWRTPIPLAIYETWHFVKSLLKPWLWPSLLLFLWHLPRALLTRIQIQRRRKRTPVEVAEQFRPRGLQPPVKPAAGQGSVDPELVSAIVVNFNGLEDTRRCICSLLDQDYPALEIVVVDNGSAVDEHAALLEEFAAVPGLRALRLNRNHGFSGGVNWGLTLATGGMLALVNNDAVLHPGCICELIDKHKQTGADAVSGRLVDIESGSQLAEALAAVNAELAGGANESLSPPVQAALAESRRNHGLSYFGMIVEDAFNGRDECFYPSGGLCLLSRNAVDALAPELFPQHYFAYHEDVWLGFALRSRGMQVAKAPHAVAVHIAGSTARSLGRVRLRFLMERNRWLNLLGWLPGGAVRRLLPLWLTGQVAFKAGLLMRNGGDLLGWAGAQLWLAGHPLYIARWRQHCREGATAADGDWLKLLSGRLRGGGGRLNAFSLNWIRRSALPCNEDAVLESNRKEPT